MNTKKMKSGKDQGSAGASPYRMDWWKRAIEKSMVEGLITPRERNVLIAGLGVRSGLGGSLALPKFSNNRKGKNQ